MLLRQIKPKRYKIRHGNRTEPRYNIVDHAKQDHFYKINR